MKKLFEIVNERNDKLNHLNELRRIFKEHETQINKEISELEELENAAQTGLNIELIQLAETVLYVHGNPYAQTDDKGKIAYSAINDIAAGCTHLKKEFYGNKIYSGYYQRTDCQYGYGPSHGSIVDEIGLTNSARKRELTDEEKDACIYYIKNYTAISKAKKGTVPA